MDAMLQSVREERQLYSHNQCVQYMCTHSLGNFGMSVGVAWFPVAGIFFSLILLYGFLIVFIVIIVFTFCQIIHSHLFQLYTIF